MKAFLIDSLGLLNRTWTDNDCKRYCAAMVELHDAGHEWIVGFVDALLREAETGAAVDKAILQSRRDSILAKIQDIYRQAEERGGV